MYKEPLARPDGEMVDTLDLGSSFWGFKSPSGYIDMRIYYNIVLWVVGVKSIYIYILIID